MSSRSRTASLVRGLAEQLMCPVCLGEYKNPMLLRCYHSFCLRCVQELLDQSGVKGVVKCPQCRTEMEIPNGDVKRLKSNFYINNLLDLMDETRLKAKARDPLVCCDHCQPLISAAEVKCVHCKVSLCRACIGPHCEHMPTQPHTIKELVTKAELEEELPAAKEDFKTCAKHGLDLRFYCCTCELLMCRECLSVNHWNHEYMLVKLGVRDIRKTIDWLLVKCKVKFLTIEKARKRVEVTQELVGSNAREMEARIDEIIDQKIRELEKKRVRLHESASQAKNEKLKQLLVQGEELAMLEASLKSGVEYTEFLLNDDHQNELYAGRKQLIERLKELSEVRVSSEPTTWWDLGLDLMPQATQVLDQMLTITNVTSLDDPDKTTVRMEGGDEGVIYHTFLNQEYTFVITLRDRNGKRITNGGQSVRVAIRIPEVTSETITLMSCVNQKVLDVSDNLNGTHSFRHKPTVEGEHFLYIAVNGRPLPKNLIWKVEGPLGFGDPVVLNIDFLPIQGLFDLSSVWCHVSDQFSWKIRRLRIEDKTTVPAIEVGVVSDSTNEKWGWRNGLRVSGTGSDESENTQSVIEEWREDETFEFFLDARAGRFRIRCQSTGKTETFCKCPGTFTRPYIEPPSYDFFVLNKELEHIIFTRPNRMTKD